MNETFDDSDTNTSQSHTPTPASFSTTTDSESTQKPKKRKKITDRIGETSSPVVTNALKEFDKLQKKVEE